MSKSSDSHWSPVSIDTSVAEPARIYDYLLGGKDNFAADRDVAEQLLVRFGKVVRDGARENRCFLARVVRHMVDALGIRQFIDLGTGLPSHGNVHEVAQQAAAGVRVVYVDRSPIVAAHGRALLNTADDTTAFVQADITDPDSVLAAPELGRLIDFSAPVGLLAVAVLHFIPDVDAYSAMQIYRERMRGGGVLALSHMSSDGRSGEEIREAVELYQASEPLVPRSTEEIGRFLDGYELVAPGVVHAYQWKHEAADPVSPQTGWMVAGMGVAT